jgi:class 3 adenylate cyclase
LNSLALTFRFMKKIRRIALLSLLLLLLCAGARAFPHISFLADYDSLSKRYNLSNSVADKAMILEWFLLQGRPLPPYTYDSTLAIYQALPGERDPEVARMVQSSAAFSELIKQKKYDEALKTAEDIIAAYGARHDTDGMSIMLNMPAMVFGAQYDVEGRLHYYAAKAELYKRTGQTRNLATCYHKLAGSYVWKGNLNEAISHYLKAGEIYKGYWPKWYANELYCAGKFYKDWGNVKRARYYFQLLDKDFSGADVSIYSLMASYALAELEIGEGRFESALQLLDAAGQFRQSYHSSLPVRKMMIALKTAEVYILQERLDTAAIILQHVARTADSLKLTVTSTHGDFELDHTFYLYHKARGDFAAASASLEASLVKAKLVKANNLKQKYERELTLWYSDKFPALAVKYAREYIALSDSVTKANGPNNVAYYETVMQETEANKNITALKEERQAQAIQLQSRKKILARSYLALGLFAALAFSLFFANRGKTKAARIIAKEKQRSDELLLNILPAEVAEELKNNGASAARQYEAVSVLFTDFVNFTGTAEDLSPQQLVQELNECFTAFDMIIGRNGLEKIKTIGDAYLAVCGLPASDPQHARKTVQAALEIRDFIANRKQHERAFDIRIGINSGPVVAGIVGVKKFAYDIWGDTVNTAARMEQHGVLGSINISESTYELVKDEFVCTKRGKIAAKNKGEVEMYLVSNEVTVENV